MNELHQIYISNFQLDGPNAGQSYEKDEDEMDFYETANAVPTAKTSFGLHK